MSGTIFVAIPMMLILAVVQTAVFPYFPLFTLTPQLPFVVSLGWGLQRGPEEGVLWAFVGGFCLDLFSLAPMGTTSLSFMVAVFIASFIAQALPSSRFFLPMFLGVLATLISLVVYFLYLRLLGQATSIELIVNLLPVSILHGGLILPVYWLVYLIDNILRPRRVQ